MGTMLRLEQVIQGLKRSRQGSLVTRLSPRKTGGGESLVTSTVKAVDFGRVIIHVIYKGHSHFSTICHVIK